MTWNDTVGFGGAGTPKVETLESPGDQIGPYKLISPLGEGGFGVVWLAERREPFVQRVAVKIVKAGMDSKAVVARFEQERQALAVMNHPGIARVLDGGLTPGGRPYFAMEYVKGDPITEFCDRNRLGIEARLRLFEQACEAIQHAHTKGIVHRDVKPGNVLAFMAEGEEPRLKVIDFGVAKALVQRMSEHTIFTETGLMIGTPEYMSPEQADPTAGDIDTRSDIYSLGVLLYELLVGETPFDPKELRKKAYGEIQRMLRETDPLSPSARLSTLVTRSPEMASRIEAARQSRTDELVRRLRGELEWIPQKAMRKEPQMRYQSALALAEDVRNYLDGRPLVAAPESAGYRVRKYVRRNRALVAGVTAVAVTLLMGLGLSTWQWWRADRARVDAEDARAEAMAARERADQARVEAEEARALAVTQRDRAESVFASAAMSRAMDSLQQADLDAVDKELQLLKDLGRDTLFPARLVGTLRDTTVFRVETRHERESGQEIPSDIVFTPDGGELVAVSGCEVPRVLRLDARTGAAIAPPVTLDHMDGMGSFVTGWAVSPDGSRVAGVGRASDSVVIWDGRSGKPLGRGNTGNANTVAFGPDSRSVAVVNASNLVIHFFSWDSLSGGSTLRPQSTLATVIPHSRFGSPDRCIDFHPDGEQLAAGNSDGTIQVWEALESRPQFRSFGAMRWDRASEQTSIAFGPRGLELACGTAGGAIQICDAVSGSLQSELRGHQDAVTSLAFSPDGRLLLSGSKDGTVRLWDVQTGRSRGAPLLGPKHVTAVAFRPDGGMVACIDQRGTVFAWDLGGGRSLSEPIGWHPAGIEGAGFSPDGRLLATVSRDGWIQLWDTLTGMKLGVPSRGVRMGVFRVAFTPAGSEMLTIGNEILSLDTHEPLDAAVSIGKGEMRSFAIRPDGKSVASGGMDGRIRMWDLATRKLMAPEFNEVSTKEDSPAVLSLAFTPASDMLVSGDQDGRVRLWDVRTGLPVHEGLVRTHAPHGVFSLAISPDGGTLASAGGDGKVGLWRLPSGESLGPMLDAHKAAVFNVVFSPDNRTLITVGRDGSVRFWDVASGRPIGGPLVTFPNTTSGLAISADGSMLAVGNYDREVRLWHAVPLRDRIGAIRERMGQVETARAMLGASLGEAGGSIDRLRDLESKMLEDPRFSGDMRIAGLIAIGEAIWKSP